MSKKNNRYRNQQRQNQQHNGYNGDCASIAESVDFYLDDSAAVRIFKDEYQALIESDTRIRILKDLMGYAGYMPPEAMVIATGLAPKGENDNA